MRRKGAEHVASVAERLVSLVAVLKTKRYIDGELDSYTLANFFDEVDEIVREEGLCQHERTIRHEGDETVYGRLGCLDCDAWLEPVRLRNP